MRCVVVSWGWVVLRRVRSVRCCVPLRVGRVARSCRLSSWAVAVGLLPGAVSFRFSSWAVVVGLFPGSCRCLLALLGPRWRLGGGCGVAFGCRAFLSVLRSGSRSLLCVCVGGAARRLCAPCWAVVVGCALPLCSRFSGCGLVACRVVFVFVSRASVRVGVRWCLGLASCSGLWGLCLVLLGCLGRGSVDV